MDLQDRNWKLSFQMKKSLLLLPAIWRVLSPNFLFNVVGEELAAAYASCDIFAFPSKSETFGQVVLEAQASGLPVVAFCAEGVCDIIQDGRTGWLAPTDPTQESEFLNFETALLAALNTEETRKTASIEAVRWAAGWTWSEATEKAVDAYRDAIRIGVGENLV